jgi:hypothetical protein
VRGIAGEFFVVAFDFLVRGFEVVVIGHWRGNSARPRHGYHIMRHSRAPAVEP